MSLFKGFVLAGKIFFIFFVFSSPLFAEEKRPVKIHFSIIEKDVEIAPGQKISAWTFEGTVPGPVIRVRQGDRVEFTLENKGTIPHSIDFHSVQTPPNKNFKSIGPGETLTFQFDAETPGVFGYHCGTSPVIQHVANGMYGAFIVDPSHPFPAAREFVLVQSEVFSSHQDIQGMISRNPNKVVFNGYMNKYVEAPLEAKPGERIRFYVVNTGPSFFSVFHVSGGIFYKVFIEGNPLNILQNLSMWTIPPGGSAILETRFPEEGMYPIYTHAMGDMEAGALGFIKVFEKAAEPGPLMP